MGLFDFLSGSDEAEQARQQNIAVANRAFQQQGDIANTYQTGALSKLGTGLTSSLGAIDTGTEGQIGAYKTALDQSTGAAREGIDAYTPLSNLGDRYGRAVNQYYNALGLNGPGGSAQARADFAVSPGYQFEQEEAARMAENKAASLGLAGSGNTLDAIAERTRQRAGAEWGDYLNRLQGFVNPELSAVSGAAAGVSQGARTLADLFQQSGTQIGGAYGSQGTQRAGLYTGEAEGGANVLGNVAGITGQASKDLAGANINANNLVAQAGMQDAANAWGAIQAGLGAIGNYMKGPTAAATASDRRFKEHTYRVGELHDGTPVWSYNYHGDPTPRIGLMADEVERRAPEAVTEYGGFKYVDYDKATERSRRLADLHA